jgi:hypothetical protein
MERSEVLDMMSGLKLYGMRSAYDETLATALKRKHEPQRCATSRICWPSAASISAMRQSGGSTATVPSVSVAAIAA